MLVPAYFNPRSPDGERPSSARACRTSHVISIHAPRVGSDIKESSIHVPNRRFQSTLPGWGATQQRRHPVQQGRISIHAPRVGSDPPPCRSCCPGRYFNPRSPGGERPATEINRLWPQLFQSTLPGWGATRGIPFRLAWTDGFQSTLPGWGATTSRRSPRPRRRHFNPRSPDGERHASEASTARCSNFNPRSPDGERLTLFRVDNNASDFNPRSPDGERRTGRTPHRAGIRDFNPRSPDGERLRQLLDVFSGAGFQSTLPGWGATQLQRGQSVPIRISIHAPRMGSD